MTVLLWKSYTDGASLELVHPEPKNVTIMPPLQAGGGDLEKQTRMLQPLAATYDEVPIDEMFHFDLNDRSPAVRTPRTVN